MPVFTVFALLYRKGRHVHKIRNTPLLTFYETPADWSDLKSTLLEAARKLYYEHDETKAEITISKFLKKRYLRPLGYQKSKIHYNKELCFAGRITFLRYQNAVKVEGAYFATPEFYEKFKDGYDMENHKKWRPPPSISLGFEGALRNPDLRFLEPLTLKTPSYAGVPRDSYMPWQQKAHTHGAYAGIYRGMYAARKQRIADQDQYEEDNTL
jgi:hypothetical protein